MIAPLRLSRSVLSGSVEGTPVFCVLAANMRIPPGDYWLVPVRRPSGSVVTVVPDSGDDILVAFKPGEIRAPYVVGALWNGSDAPPESTYVLSDANTPRPNGIHVSLGLETLIGTLRRPVRLKVS